jgi:hypothetical protein
VPLTLVVGVSLGGAGVGVGVGVGSGVGAGVLTVGPGCVGDVGVSLFPHAAIGRIEQSMSPRNVVLIVLGCICETLLSSIE